MSYRGLYTKILRIQTAVGDVHEIGENRENLSPATLGRLLEFDVTIKKLVTGHTTTNTTIAVLVELKSQESIPTPNPEFLKCARIHK